MAAKLKRRIISSIAISGIACSGKTTLANLLAETLSWDHGNTGDYLRDLAKKEGIPIESFGNLNEQTLRDSDLLALQGMQTRVHCVWEGRLSIWLAKNIPDILRIYCVADFKVRIRRYAARENVSLEEAETKLLKRDEEEKAVFYRLYGIGRLIEETRPDIIMDTSSSDPRQLLYEITSAVTFR